MMQKQIYFYWGNQPMSFLRYMTIRSFSHYNPDWKIILIFNNIPAQNKWITSEEQDNNNYRGIDYRKSLEQIKNLKMTELSEIFPVDYISMSNVHIKDILNWYLLSTRSCVVADMDITFCRSMESSSAFDWNAHVNICSYDFYRNYIPVSFMMSNMNNEGINHFYSEVFENSLKSYNPNIYESCGTNCIPYHSILEISEKFKELKIHKMDEMIVFPFVKPDPSAVGDLTWDADNRIWFTVNTVGVHWYGGQPKSQTFNNIITKDNFNRFNNTISNIIKEIL